MTGQQPHRNRKYFQFNNAHVCIRLQLRETVLTDHQQRSLAGMRYMLHDNLPTLVIRNYHLVQGKLSCVILPSFKTRPDKETRHLLHDNILTLVNRDYHLVQGIFVTRHLLYFRHLILVLIRNS